MLHVWEVLRNTHHGKLSEIILGDWLCRILNIGLCIVSPQAIYIVNLLTPERFTNQSKLLGSDVFWTLWTRQ